MRLDYEYNKLIVFGKKYDTHDKTDMKIFVDDIKTQFRKLEQENNVLRNKFRNVMELLSDVE